MSYPTHKNIESLILKTAVDATRVFRLMNEIPLPEGDEDFDEPDPGDEIDRAVDFIYDPFSKLPKE